MRFKNYFIVFALCLSLLLLMVHLVPNAMALEHSVEISCGGQPVNSIALDATEQKTLSAKAVAMDQPSFQWQILQDPQNDLWVDIYDCTEADCVVTSALMKSMLDDADSAYIRCAATGGAETVFSDVVCVTVIPEPDPMLQATSFAQTRAVEPSAFSDAPTTVAADDKNAEYVTITIKYLEVSSLTSGVEAAIYNPYTATIEKGSAFKQNVLSPTFLGFAPYLDSNSDGTIDDKDASAATVYLNYTDLMEDVEINVYYKPIKVNYAIKYFFQNINDDLYTENHSLYHVAQAETGTIIENDYFEENAGVTTGFTKMYHIPESVAADGSTVFECYYDRNYYLMQFDLNGGYGVDPIYARYGTPFVVNDPVRHGYVFDGWKLTHVDADGDGVWDDSLPDDKSLVSSIPAYNCHYQAQWRTIDTKYTVVYWLDGKYLGSRIVSEQSGKKVSGSDDLANAQICGFAEHTHSDSNGCYGNCTASEHVHTLKCYTNNTLQKADELTDVNHPDGFPQRAYNNLTKKVSSPEEGYVYKYYAGTKFYNFFYYDKTWYYLGTNSTYNGISVTINDNIGIGDYSNAKATTNCGNGQGQSHTHTDACLSCEEEVHTHDASCKIDATYYVYDRADKDVLVEGDGSTVVNVYYKPKEYTLRFYYAATTGDGRDTDGDGINDTYSTVKIIGGSTTYFGTNGPNTSDDETLLNNIFSTNQAGTVTKLPQLNAEGKSRNYTLGTLPSGNTSYHYIEFRASYGQDISELWPCSVFESATRTSIDDNTNGWNGTEAFVSAWNGEHHVWYSQNNENQTIKGNYEKLDKKLLFDLSKFSDETTVSYLCFWENGAGNVGWNVPELYRYNIWVPVLAGENTDGLIIKDRNNGVTYKRIESYDTCDNSTPGEQTQPSLEGYKANGYDYKSITLTDEQKTLYNEGYDMHFYYARESYSFAMKNHGAYLENIKVDAGGNGGVAYGTKLSTLDAVQNLGENYTPPYPSTLEEKAYHFGGWYTTEQCIPGTEFDLSTATMPANGLILYANWVPKKHTVRYFTTYDDMLAASNIYKKIEVDHGTIAGQVDTPTRVDNSLELIFAGWFYMENGQKKAFSPLNMPVNRDMDIFAEWSSHSPQPYCISYVLRSDKSEKVAEDSTGFAYGGSTRTFNAKAGDPYNQLYAQYNNGYFPTVSSHSITIQAEADNDHPVHNVYTFEYVEAHNIEYTVRYVNKETNVVMDTVTCYTSSAVVTERFKAYEDMVPDAFYKRLILEVEEENGNWVGTDNNVITFYYTPNDTSAYYAVHFMLEKLNATDAETENYAINGTGGYEKSGAHVEGVGTIGTTVSYTPQQISGFHLITNNEVPKLYSDGEESVATGSNGDYDIPIKQSGTELYLFYERNSYPYKVHYYKYNTTESLADSKNGTADYGSEVTEKAKAIEGYTCVSDQTKTITIREDENGVNGLNVIIFYYSPKQYTAEYVAVPEGGGSLSKTIEVINGGDSLVGSAPTANTNYEFNGWYLDKDCKIPVTDKHGTIDSATNQFTPDKSKLSETGRNIFYAKFKKLVGDLTIVRSNADASQVFVYDVKNTETNKIITVTIEGNGSAVIKNLPLGNYTVTQKNDWSWRYTDAAVSVNHQDTAGTTVTFDDAEANNKWINGNSLLKKNRKGQSE